MPRVLVVDDDQDFRENLMDILEVEGYEVAAAADGFEALRQIKDAPHFDVILMDIKMPEMNGVETFRRIKSIDPDSAVIMVTAYSEDQLVRDALHEGPYAIFYKPVELERLLNMVKHAGQDGMLVMVVDDDPFFSANLRDVLEKEGYRVLLARSGEEAVDVAKGNNVDLYLIDMKMPFMNGLETYLALKEIKREVVAVMITAFRDEMQDLIEQAITSRAYTCLFKPVDMQQLLGMLAAVREKTHPDEGQT